MRKVQITKLKTPYVSVEGSYGGNQGWFKPAEGATGKDSRGLSVRKAKTLEGFGCGLIGGSDIILHLLGRSVLSNGSEKGYFKVRELYTSNGKEILPYFTETRNLRSSVGAELQYIFLS